MIRRWLRDSNVTSRLVAVASNLAIIAIVIAGTGGGDFPIRR